MPDIPNWLTAVISSVIGAGLTFLATRRLYLANVAEKDASTAKIYAEVAEDAVRQLQQVRGEIPGWMQKLAAETARADAAEKRNANARAIQEQARIIVEEVASLSYVKDPDEPESKAEKRFKAIKAAAKKIADFAMKDENGKE